MRIVNAEIIEKTVYELALKAGRNISPSCMDALEKAERGETNETTRFALQTVIENAKTAKSEEMPVCQDTGMAVVIIEMGDEVFVDGSIGNAVNEGVRRAYKDGYFRQSVCDPLTRINTADNTPAVLHIDYTSGDKIKIAFIPKGFGSENMSRIYMLTPAEGKEGIIRSVTETVRLAGSRPCPPVYVGVGIGGTFDSCAFLAKKALTREVGVLNARADVREIEEECLKRINALKIGAQGFGGETTAIGVAAEIAPTHVAGLPVAVNIQCHCVRCEKAVI